MLKVTRALVLLTLLFSHQAWAQKVKYKDIYGLLSTKQYESAEPFLKKYLKDNTDNPNAYLFMGVIFHEKSNKDDVLKQTKRAIADMDSAILFYDKAYKSITEREIKRNDEYYQSYNRRDLRTGEFGVKLSDIQFDLEKKMEGLREKIDRVKMMKYYFNLSDSIYKKCTSLYKKLQGTYPSNKEFYLRSDNTTLQTLQQLTTRFDSCLQAFERYKSSAATVGKTGYSQTMTKNEIRDLKTDGASPADFYQNDLQVWDYKLFADKAKTAIEKDIMPMRENLISYDMQINKLREKLKNDSVSVKSDLTKLVDKLLMEQLKKYDESPLPMKVFSIKIADLEYGSLLAEHKPLRDSADVHLQYKLVKDELKAVSGLDSIASSLSDSDVDTDAKNYDFFITNTYNNTTVLKSFIHTVKEYAERERKSKQAKLLQKENNLRWLVTANDSIPLVADARPTRFRPLQILEERYTVGLQYTDSLSPSGYLYTITRSRKPDVKVVFPVEKPVFKLSRASMTRALTYSDAAGQIYFVLFVSERAGKENKHVATLAKIYKSDGLAWSNNYALSFVPKEITFKPESGELVLKNDAQQSVVDKNGKLLK
jgi:hypothetical protein